MPLGYQVTESTWFYLSLLLIVAVFFRFHRFWSLRNLDLCLLLASGPGLLLVREESHRVLGFAWLFSITALFLVRLLADSLLQKRPPLSQNLNAQGMTFLCASAFILLTLQAVSQPFPPESTQQTVQRAHDLVTLTDPGDAAPDERSDVEAGPTSPLIAAPVLIFEQLAPRVMAMMAHLAVIIGLLFVGRNLFADTQLGLAMGTLYLLLPCTAYDVGEFNHVLPAALIVWAIVAYRRPVVSGVLMGLACGALFFPLFLVPLWIVFYGRRGGARFATALVIVAALLLGSLALTSASPGSFWQKTMGTIRLAVLAFEAGEDAINFWKEGEYDSPYRIPVIAAYFVMLAILTFWPRKKNLEHLIAHSAALIVGTQFWYPQQGGVYLSWYMPLLMIVVFRPRLTHLSAPADRETIVEVKKDPVRPSRLAPTSRVHLFR